MAKKQRIDSLLVVLNYFPDTDSAKKAIILGRVFVDEQKILKTTELFLPTCTIRVEHKDKYVSRGAHKLLSCIDALSLSGIFQDKVVYDVGSSTGGFTQVALECGAAKVIAIDVGTNQLDYSLRVHPQVTSVEKTNILNFASSDFDAPDVLVADISFQSVARIAVKLIELATIKNAYVIALIKPQFELPRHLIPEGGVVTDKAHIAKAVGEVKKILEHLKVANIKEFYCPVLGRNGNQEVFLVFKIAPQY